MNSLSREISESVIYSSTAKDMWIELDARFGQSSVAKLFQLQKKLSDLVQGSSDIVTYHTKKKSLWDKLDTLDFFIPWNYACSCRAKEKKIKSKQDEQLVQVLIGLNDSYCAPRDTIPMILPLPSIPNAYTLLIQEEKQMEVKNTPKFSSESSSFIASSQGYNVQRPFSTNFKGEKKTMITRSLILFADIARKQKTPLTNITKYMVFHLI